MKKSSKAAMLAGNQKPDWREWQWGVMAEKLGDASRRVVAYLSGPGDLDRDVATSHGFSDSNLIAVNVDKGDLPEKPQSLYGAVEDFVFRWPESVCLDAVSLDFSSGLTEKTTSVVRALQCCRNLNKNSVVAVNLLRGRDAKSNTFRRTACKKYIGDELIKDEVCHRGQAWCVNAALMLVQQSVVPHPQSGVVDIGRICDLENYADIYERFKEAWCAMKCRIFTYKSGPTYFDSAVINWPTELICGDNPLTVSHGFVDMRDSLPFADEQKRRIIAQLAAMVRKMNKSNSTH